MKVEIKKLPKSTVQLQITVPAEKVKEAYQQSLENLAKTAEIKGFRKGNAPIDLVEESLDKGKIHGETINVLLEKYYVQALKENKINPVSNPKVEIQAFDIEKDFEFTATMAVRPDVKLGNYKKAIEKRAKDKKKEVQDQKQEALKKGESLDHVHDHLHSQEIIDLMVDEAEVEVPGMLVEEEVDRMMTRLVDQMQSLNMEMDQYLKAQDKTSDQIREEFSANAERNLKAEFVLAQAVKDAGIEVTDEEIEETAKATGDPQAIENIKNPTHRWYIKSILEKNKLISGLMEEFGGETHAAPTTPEEKEEK
jgi:FKBP-type peptidyl-prolyl cis-trans isomerase (trigger factor)